MSRNPARRVKRLPPLKDPFAAHEALDRAHLAVSFFQGHVAEHFYVRAEPKLRGWRTSLWIDWRILIRRSGQQPLSGTSARPEALYGRPFAIRSPPGYIAVAPPRRDGLA